jgi:hypothetical protein
MNAVDAAHMAYLVRWAAGRGTRLVARGGTRLRAPVATYSTFTAGAGRSRRFVASTYETALLLCSALLQRFRVVEKCQSGPSLRPSPAVAPEAAVCIRSDLKSDCAIARQDQVVLPASATENSSVPATVKRYS